MKIGKSLQNYKTKFFSNNDRKTLFSNFAYLSLLQVISYVFPLITIPYLARVIGVDGYGSIAFASSVIIYFQTITEWGFSFTAVRDIAKCKSDTVQVSRIFSKVMYSKLILMIFSLLILILLINIVPLFYENRLILYYTFLIIPGTILFPDWLFQALENMKYITIMSFFSRLIFTILVFFVIKEKSDYLYQPLLSSIGMLISGVWALWYVRKRFHIRFVSCSYNEILSAIKGSTNMFISLFLPNLYTNFSVVLLGFTSGQTATGLFSAGKSFVDIFDRFSMVLSRAFYPFLARRLDKHDIYVHISGTLSIIMGVFLFIMADVLINIFYTSEFSEAVTILRIMSVSPFFLFLMNTYGTNYLVLRGREDILRNIILYCSLGGFVLAWFAINNLSYIGVAITITSVWGIRGILTWAYAQKIKKND